MTAAERVASILKTLEAGDVKVVSFDASSQFAADLHTLLAALQPNEEKVAHDFWGAGEKDCPREIKAGNGELRKLRCKLCGKDNPRDDRCLAALPTDDDVERAVTPKMIEAGAIAYFDCVPVSTLSPEAVADTIEAIYLAMKAVDARAAIHTLIGSKPDDQ